MFGVRVVCILTAVCQLYTCAENLAHIFVAQSREKMHIYEMMQCIIYR